MSSAGGVAPVHMDFRPIMAQIHTSWHCEHTYVLSNLFTKAGRHILPYRTWSTVYKVSVCRGASRWYCSWLPPASPVQMTCRLTVGMECRYGTRRIQHLTNKFGEQHFSWHPCDYMQQSVWYTHDCSQMIEKSPSYNVPNDRNCGMKQGQCLY
jgi:hypothetical protein